MKIKGIPSQGKPCTPRPAPVFLGAGWLSAASAALVIVLLTACIGNKEETPVIPPPTYPLSQVHIGYGVINVQYTRISSEPSEDSVSPGYLRRGSVVRVTERRLLRNSARGESWVFVEGAFNGWLRESLLDIYDNEMQAQTASRSMGM